MSKKNNRKSFRYTGLLKSFFMWPVYIGFILLIVNISMIFINKNAAKVISIFMLIYLLACGFMFLYLRPRIMKSIIEFASNYSQIQKQLLYNLSVPYCIMDMEGNVLWTNKVMRECIDNKEYRKKINSIIPEINPALFPDEDNVTTEINFSYSKRDYRAEIKLLDSDVLLDEVDILENNSDESLVAMYLFDETDINMYIQKLKDERIVIALLYVDNYEDALKSVDDVRKSLFVGLIDKRVNKYFTPGAAIVRKIEKDQYMVAFKYKFLEKLEQGKFSLLEEIKKIKIGEEQMPVTLSIAVGAGGLDYAKNYEYAKTAMDLAQSRGGDQAVIKDGERISYYGGKSQQMDKNTRVKVRVKAHAFRQILIDYDNVLIMGHSIADIDSFGSAVGIYNIAKKFGKEAHIVLGEVTTSIRPFVNRFIEKEEYPKDMFIKPDSATDYLNNSTVVVVVDVNRPKRTECPELLEKCKTIVVFDHHRTSTDTINGAILSYVDPYASSACEMIAEMIQYIDDNVKLKAIEADTLYAGINIDTDGFNSKSGPRTFEAAAFLRRNGADVTRVRKMLRTNMEEYKSIARTVSMAEVYRDSYAFSVYRGEGMDNPTIGGAKAANQLLDISGIKASFVVTNHNNKIYVSARSIDEVNVQIIMEKLGGGGHMSIAGVQLSDVTEREAIDEIKEILDRMIKEGEL